MTQTFYKYQGAGNDFLMIDNRQEHFHKDTQLISHLCDRRFGIGADGLILLENDKQSDFKMVYYNANGQKGSMCGNGARCIVAFAKRLGIIDKETHFEAVDGLHHAIINQKSISLKMKDVTKIEVYKNHLFIDTGSPHHIVIKNALNEINVASLGRDIAHGSPYFEKGTNVNFVEQKNENSFSIRTYERGVEAETLACGTGATAVAIAMHHLGKTSSNAINIDTKGGEILKIFFAYSDNRYSNVYLEGKAKFVFEGEIKI